MVRVGFIVEGDSERILIESSNFRVWAEQSNIEICQPVINVQGNGNLCPSHIDACITDCRNRAKPDKIVVLTDLECDPCVTATKARLGNGNIDLILVAKKALEAWFLADTIAIRHWLENEDFQGEPAPEETPEMPWERLKEIGRNYHKTKRGPGSNRKKFARKMINCDGFSIERAANHLKCPSAKYFLEKLQKL